MAKNKISLEIKIIGESGLTIRFIHVDKKFLSVKDSENPGADDFKYFISADTNFYMYSHEDGDIIDGEDGLITLCLPDSKVMKPGYSLSHKFKDNNSRKHYLKLMYDYLPQWADEWFDDSDMPRKAANTGKMIVHKGFWVY